MVASGTQLLIPGLALAEVASAVVRGTGDPALARAAIDAIERLPGLRIVAVDVRLGRLAAAVAGRHRLRGCDAVYAALARAARACLVSLDREQLDRSPSDLVAYTPEHWIAASEAS